MSINVIEELAKLDIASPEAYAKGYPHTLWERLRNEAPILKMNIDGYYQQSSIVLQIAK